MKMLMLDKARTGDSGRSESRMGYGGAEGSYGARNGMEMGYGEMGMEPMENRRRRDSRGRFRSEMGYGEMEGNYGRAEMGGDYDRSRMEMGYRPFPDSAGGGERMNQIGFRAGPEFDDNYRMEAGYQGGREMEHYTSPMQMGRGEAVPKLTRETAEEWARSMENEDGTKGPHWTMEQTKQVMAQRGVNMDPVHFWIALNAMYSDYSKVLKKHGVGDKIDLYVDLAKAFVEDKDAQPEKLARYYEYIVKH